MDNSNIIISVIIVLCIAAGVTAYGISEGDNAVFNDLTGFSPDSSSSGSNVINDILGTDANGGAGASGSSGSSSGNNGAGGGTSSGGSGSGSGSGTTKITPDKARSIASGFIGEAGAYVSNVKDDGTMYICYISNSTGDVVDAIGISYSGENLGKV